MADTTTKTISRATTRVFLVLVDEGGGGGGGGGIPVSVILFFLPFLDSSTDVLWIKLSLPSSGRRQFFLFYFAVISLISLKDLKGERSSCDKVGRMHL